jgi:hypothetical protein
MPYVYKYKGRTRQDKILTYVGFAFVGFVLALMVLELI